MLVFIGKMVVTAEGSAMRGLMLLALLIPFLYALFLGVKRVTVLTVGKLAAVFARYRRRLGR